VRDQADSKCPCRQVDQLLLARHRSGSEWAWRISSPGLIPSFWPNLFFESLQGEVWRGGETLFFSLMTLEEIRVLPLFFFWVERIVAGLAELHTDRVWFRLFDHLA